MKITLKKGFSLIEVLLGVVIFSMVMTGAFYALSSVNIAKIKLIEETKLEKEAFYFSEVFFDLIKKGGTIDYEEYFNRLTLNNAEPNLYSNGHYSIESDFGNGSSTMYYCISKNGTNVYPRSGTATGCLDDFNTNRLTTVGATYHTDVYALADKNLLYNQYLYQFIDYNSDADADAGDENVDGTISRDDDDEFLGEGPEVFPANGQVYEIYLISGNEKKRTFIRWNVGVDSDAPVGVNCTGLGGDPALITGDGCLGKFEYLVLEGVDWGYDHTLVTEDSTQYDGKVDTWIFDRNTYGLSSAIVATATNDDDYWIPLFSDTMSVKNVEFFMYPHKNIKYAWKDFSPSVNVSAYVQIKLTLSPSWKKRKGMRGVIPEYSFNTTISLTDIFSL